MFSVVRLNTYTTLSDRRRILNFTLSNKQNYDSSDSFDTRIKSQMITVVKVMKILMSIRKASKRKVSKITFENFTYSLILRIIIVEVELG